MSKLHLYLKSDLYCSAFIHIASLFPQTLKDEFIGDFIKQNQHYAFNVLLYLILKRFPCKAPGKGFVAHTLSIVKVLEDKGHYE